MAEEQRWTAVSSTPLQADGGADGTVEIASTLELHVHQEVFLNSSAEPSKKFVILAVNSSTQLTVAQSKNDDPADVSAYKVADNASLSAQGQNRVTIPQLEYLRGEHEEEPRVAKRVINVDEQGRIYGSNRAMPVDLQNATIGTNIRHANDPRIQAISITNADTEISVSIPQNTQRFFLKVRDGAARLRLAFSSGETQNGGNYFTVERGFIFDSKEVDWPSNKQIYVRSTKDNVVLENINWVLT